MATQKKTGGGAPLLQRPDLDAGALRAGLELIDGLEGGQDDPLEGWLFSGMEAAWASADGVELRQCLLRGCELRGASLKRGSFVDVVFERCDLSNARLSEAFFQRVRFVDCKLLGADLDSARLRSAAFTGCVLRMANFSLSKAQDVRFAQCDLTEAALRDLRECKRVEFSACDLRRAELAGTRLAGMDLTTCEIGGNTWGPGLAEVRGAIVTPLQAMELARALGVRIQE